MKSKVELQWALFLAVILSVTACNVPLQGTGSNAATPAQATTPANTISPVVGEVSVKLTLVTGSDGTADNLVFGLFDSSGNSLFTTTLDKEGDLQPDQTDVYEFSAP